MCGYTSIIYKRLTVYLEYSHVICTILLPNQVVITTTYCSSCATLACVITTVLTAVSVVMGSTTCRAGFRHCLYKYAWIDNI